MTTPYGASSGGGRTRALCASVTVALALICLAQPARSRAPDVQPHAVRRTVIALYSGATGTPAIPHAEAAPHRFLTMPLNHLGMQVRTQHVASGPPPQEWLSDAAAVITWFEADVPLPDWVWPWLEQHVPNDIARVVHLCSVAPLATDKARFEAWFSAKGLTALTQYVKGAARVQAEFKDDALCMYEGNPRRHASYDGVGGQSEDHDVWVRTRPRRDESAPWGTPVLTAPWGGLGLEPWTTERGASQDEFRWYIDPFVFFRDALGLQGVPAPAPEVRNGRRLFFFHVDGDGFESISLIDAPRRCGEVFIDKILKKYQIPCTMSIIVGSLSDTLTPEKPTAMMDAAKRMFALPYVEVASHGVLHPFVWTDTYGHDPDIRKHYGFVTVGGFEYSQYNEVAESVKFIRSYLLPEGKDCVGMLWTGDCLPSGPAFQACKDAGVWNLNGGTYRWDPQFDSVGFVSARQRWIDDYVQIYAGAANDNEYPGFFAANPSAFAGADTTIERTGSPRILKPANIYAHFYSVEKHARLKALVGLLDRWAVRERTLVVPASTYVKAAESAVGARIASSPDGWQLSDFGNCRTVRFDDTTLEVDWARSRGIHGARRIGASLFVHLSGPQAVVATTTERQLRPHVYDANVLFDEVALTETGVRFTCASSIPREIVVAGYAPKTDVSLRVGGRIESAQADENGRVTLKFPPGGQVAVEVSAL